MQVVHRISEVASAGSAVAIGNFDGVHLGHRALLVTAREEAHRLGLPLVVLTFFPHPVEVLNPGKTMARLSTATEKLALLEALGVDTVLVEHFDHALAELSPEAFFERYLVQGLKARSVHVGMGFRFGKHRAGDGDTLARLCAAQGIALTFAPLVSVDGDRVSSSRIRELVGRGDCVEARRLLGRPYSIHGQVRHGDHRGTGLGFPTANLHFPSDKCLPQRGVYVTRVEWQRQMYRSVTNVGIRPTFLKDGESRVEVHVLDLDARLYDEFLQVEFLERLRDEKKFESIDALKAQITVDVDHARRFKEPA